jgi:hypothetical protein
MSFAGQRMGTALRVAISAINLASPPRDPDPDGAVVQHGEGAAPARLW